MLNESDQDGSESGAIVNHRDAAEMAGLIYVDDESHGIRRRKAGKGFAYTDEDGHRVSDPATLARIRKLAIPPAYQNVWISPDENGHIQATGRDAKGRKQYRYHPKWTEVRDSTKYEHVLDFAAGLPAIRAHVAKDLARRGLPREKVLAVITTLLEQTLIRVGNSDYVKQNKSYGLTTLMDQHVDIEGSELRFHFKGKSGKQWRLKFADKRVARVVKACQDIPGQHLFQYIDHDGARHAITSTDVNAYLRQISGRDISAKDFRTWHGTVLAAMALSEFETVAGASAAKKNIKLAIESVSAKLGNTPTICRKCYVHPEVLNCYLDGNLLNELKQEVEHELSHELHSLGPEEAATLVLLQKRLQREINNGGHKHSNAA